MKFYFAYKYSNNKDKTKLKEDLEKLDLLLKSWGDDTFILGRDVKKWQHVKLGYIKQIPVIYGNMSRCDAVLIYANSPEISIGLAFELVVSKILNKKTILLYENYNASIIKRLTTRNFKINTINEVTKEMLQ